VKMSKLRAKDVSQIAVCVILLAIPEARKKPKNKLIKIKDSFRQGLLKKLVILVKLLVSNKFSLVSCIDLD